MQRIVLFQVKYVNNQYGYSATTIDGELILFRLAYRVVRMYQIGTILSSVVLLPLQSGSVHGDDDDTLDTITIMQQVVLYQHAHDETALNMNVLVVLFQIKYKRNQPTTIDGELIRFGVNDTLNMNVLVVLF